MPAPPHVPTSPEGPRSWPPHSTPSSPNSAKRTDRSGSSFLIDFARSLPPLPDRLEKLKDADHRVEECQSPVFLFVEAEGDRLSIHADAPLEAPTVRGFVAILVEGLSGATVEDVFGGPPCPT